MSEITREQFEDYIEEGIHSLPAWVRERMDNIAFLLEEEPSHEDRELVGMTHGERVFGLYHGVPLTERGVEPPLLPDTVTIYMRPILDTYDTPADVRECVINTIWHEVAHYFGHDEEWIEREEKKRGKTK